MKTQQPCAMQSIVAHTSAIVFLVEGLVEGAIKRSSISSTTCGRNVPLEPPNDQASDINLAGSIGALL
jgi:hypothetical protein